MHPKLRHTLSEADMSTFFWDRTPLFRTADGLPGDDGAPTLNEIHAADQWILTQRRQQQQQQQQDTMVYDDHHFTLPSNFNGRRPCLPECLIDHSNLSVFKAELNRESSSVFLQSSVAAALRLPLLDPRQIPHSQQQLSHSSANETFMVSKSLNLTAMQQLMLNDSSEQAFSAALTANASNTCSSNPKDDDDITWLPEAMSLASLLLMESK